MLNDVLSSDSSLGDQDEYSYASVAQGLKSTTQAHLKKSFVNFVLEPDKIRELLRLMIRTGAAFM